MNSKSNFKPPKKKCNKNNKTFKDLALRHSSKSNNLPTENSKIQRKLRNFKPNTQRQRQNWQKQKRNLI